MSEELKDNLELTTAEVDVQEETIEEYIPEMAKEEPVCEVEPQVQPEVQSQAQPETLLTQAEDGSWRHAENSPFSPFYVPDRKQKNNNGLIIGLLILLLLLLIGGLIFAVSKLVEAAVGEATDAWNDSTGAVEEFWDEVKKAFEKEDTDEEDGYDYYDESDAYDYFDDIQLGSYEPSPDDDYYVEIVSAIREDLSYSVTFDEYAYTYDEESVSVSIEYAQVSKDLANSEKINQQLFDNAMYYAKNYDLYEIEGLRLNVKTHITYMDEETLSVVIDERLHKGASSKYDLFCMNFDLKTGTLLNNSDIIEVSDNLVDAFIDQSLYQNGETDSVTDYSKEEIKEFLSAEESLILFYTPVGLEIGYNHPYGWVTATLKEYQQYLKKL